MINVLFVFLDGVGLGEAGPANPLSARHEGLEALAGGARWLRGAAPVDQPLHVFRAIDATLGVEGLPQSGTGQATMLTGTNCAVLAGRHYGPYPHSATRETIASANVFAQVQALFPGEESSVAFANAYPDRFFELARQRDWWTVTTRSCLDANVPIRTAAMLQEGAAISADITGEGWPQAEPHITPVSEEAAARRLFDIARARRFTLFEYYLTDKAGHGRSPKRAADVLTSVDRLLLELSRRIDVRRDLLVVTSDHGNIEDLSTKSHTRNPVPLIAYGRGARHFNGVVDLCGVTPAILEALKQETRACTG